MRGRIQNRVRIGVVALCLVFFVGLWGSLQRISQVNLAISGVNQVLLPVNRVLAQLQVDSELLVRESQKGLGFSRWSDPLWKPKAPPEWIFGLLERETAEMETLLSGPSFKEWKGWTTELSHKTENLKEKSTKIYQLLNQGKLFEAKEAYPTWWESVEALKTQVDQGAQKFDKDLKAGAERAEKLAGDLRLALQILLASVLALSLLVIWFGERALRPLAHLTELAKRISSRGLEKGDKANILALSVSRRGADEVGELTQEFHRMATVLLEREKTVESQKERLEEQHRALEKIHEMQKRLEASERLAALGRMSAQVAHEVRNPLHSIGLEAEVALEISEKISEGGPPKAMAPSLKQSIQSILASVERLERVTGNYLSLSRVPDAEKKEINLLDVLESVLATYSPVLMKDGVRVDWESEPGADYRIQGDPGLLEQAIGNLIRNSSQAGAKKIHFRLSHKEGEVHLRIEDDGPGIAPEVRFRLFTPFVTTKTSGTGLGLSFVKKTLEDHGGSIRSLETSRGAAFECSIPRLIPERQI